MWEVIRGLISIIDQIYVWRRVQMISDFFQGFSPPQEYFEKQGPIG